MIYVFRFLFMGFTLLGFRYGTKVWYFKVKDD